MSKPVELIIANVVHEIQYAISNLSVEAQEVAKKVAATGSDPVAQTAARSMLAAIAFGADLSQVLKALASVGGPSTQDEIAQRLSAARDAMAREAGGKTAEASNVSR
ncbi:hypothetical protein [Hyphomicrobium sp. DY-1]|uniref:hypothetical protein n=1 Tax=Hyphomicrobium sp. DY-1 TaxID=3075650 RepID=UPI0039C257E5